MVEPLKTSKQNSEKEVFRKKVLAPWRFQGGYERWPNRSKAHNLENGRTSHAFNRDISNDQLRNEHNSNHVMNFECSNRNINNGEVLELNCFSQGLHQKVEHEENAKGTKDSVYSSGNSKKAQVMSKLYKAVATWRFQPVNKRQFPEGHNLRRKVFMRPYPPTKYHSSVKTPALCEFDTDPGLDLNRKGSLSKGCNRDSVMSSLHDFRSIYRELLVENETQGVVDLDIVCGRRDWLAFRKYKERNSYDDARKFVGEVPGTRVGDVFHLRVELCVVGLHHQQHLSVDFIKREEGNLAISVVSYGNLAELKKKNKIDVLEFSSSVIASDVTFDGSNLALIRSLETKTPVRFIYGFTLHLAATEMLKMKANKINTYVYCGLYTVEKFSRKRSDDGSHYFYVFRLRRIAGQTELDIRAVLESRKFESFLFPAMHMEDLSLGKEKVPISVVNFINSEKPPFFKYITGLRTRVLQDPTPPNGCGCTNGCSDSVKCACVVKNGGELPFNAKGRIVEAKPLVFECGPACKCPPTCPNRVSQHGVKFRLQVFKTKDMGWGVRALELIPSGSFVCEYVAELIADQEAQRRTNDEYLFTIGDNYYDEELWEGLKSIPTLQKDKNSKNPEGDDVFTLDASEFGNFTRFINHSCMPNLYAQNVLYDHDNIRKPRIMFFASEDIQPMEELAYHYNYTLDQVHDANGNVKKKKCFCGTEECTGWLY